MICRKYDRPDIKQITKQWVRENCKNITDRDMGLLHLLYDNKRRLLRRDQIEILYPVFASTDRLNKRLNALYKMHVIDKIYPQVGIGEGSSKQHICLDRSGIILLGVDKYNKPIMSDDNGNKSLPLGWEHKILINDYECSIVEILKELGGDLLHYEVEEPHFYGDSKIIPDILCLMRYNGKGYLFFIEVDLGTEDIPYIKDKVQSYIDYYMSNNWVTKDWNKYFKKPTFPKILFLTEENRPKRIKTLQDYTSETSLKFEFSYHTQFKQLLKDVLGR